MTPLLSQQWCFFFISDTLSCVGEKSTIIVREPLLILHVIVASLRFSEHAIAVHSRVRGWGTCSANSRPDQRASSRQRTCRKRENRKMRTRTPARGDGMCDHAHAACCTAGFVVGCAAGRCATAHTPGEGSSQVIGRYVIN